MARPELPLVSTDKSRSSRLSLPAPYKAIGRGSQGFVKGSGGKVQKRSVSPLGTEKSLYSTTRTEHTTAVGSNQGSQLFSPSRGGGRSALGTGAEELLHESEEFELAKRKQRIRKVLDEQEQQLHPIKEITSSQQKKGRVQGNKQHRSALLSKKNSAYNLHDGNSDGGLIRENSRYSQNKGNGSLEKKNLIDRKIYEIQEKKDRINLIEARYKRQEETVAAVAQAELPNENRVGRRRIINERLLGL